MTLADERAINEQCDLLIDQLGKSTESDQLNEFFNIIIAEVTKCSPSTTDLKTMNKIVTTLTLIDKKQLNKQCRLIQHQLLTVFRDYLIKYLYNQEEIEIVTNLSILFHNIYYNVVLTDEIVQVFLYKPLIDEICIFFNEIEKHSNETKLVEVIDRLVEIFQRIQTVYLTFRENSMFELLLISISKCFTSKFFIEKLEALPKTMLDLNKIQKLLFDTSVEFLYWQPYENNMLRRKKICTISETLLEMTVNLMSSSYMSEPLINLACLLSLNVMVTDNSIDENTVNKNYYALIDLCIPHLNNDEQTAITKRTLLSILCHLTYNIDLVVHMKSNLSLKSYLLKLTESDDSEISFNAYRILSVIMNEEDIKRLGNSSKIVSLFNLYLISMIDDPIQETAFQSLLHSLRSKFIYVIF